MSLRRVCSNFVNLGGLYSVPPWGTVPPFGLTVPQKNSVNLGSLYAHSKSKNPTGYAYFEDGSMFILPFAWLPHDAFEARMKIAAQFVSGPTPKMQAIRTQGPHRTRYIIINKDRNQLRENTLRILARNAQDGQRVVVVDPCFENVELVLDPTESRPISARFNNAPQLRYEDRLRTSKALETFRGTLIDGVLQPNVRLGNGLKLSPRPEILKPQLAERRRARDREASRLRENVGLPRRAPAKLLDSLGGRSLSDRPLPPKVDKPKPSQRTLPRDGDLELREAQLAQRERELIQLQQELLRQTMRIKSIPPRQDRHHWSPPRHDSYANKHRTREQTGARIHSEYDTTAADIEAKRKALEQEERLLRYKRNAWLLEQKLAQAQTTRRPQSKRAARRYDTEGQEHGAQHSPDYPSEQEDVPNAQQDHGRVPDAFDLENSSPTEVLETLRSRIRLPTRGTMRSRRDPR